MAIEVVHWNPKRPVAKGLVGKILPIRRPVDNFGDLIGPVLVDRILEERSIDATTAVGNGRLLTVGSILHFAKSLDTVWGSGINGKEIRVPRSLDVRAVRGPITHRILADAGIKAPAIFGDPALLWAKFWPRSSYTSGTTQGVGIVPNLHDYHRYYAEDPRVINPRGNPHDVIRQIAQCEMIVSTSLHGIVIAESFGIPARLVPPTSEPMHKYFDYYLGTGRPAVEIAASVSQAIELGGEVPPVWDGDLLYSVFPYDLWT